MSKQCNKCLESKDKNCFHKDKHKKDGLSTICKDCRRKYISKYYDKNKEIIKLNVRQYAKENRDKVLESKREYYANNKETFRVNRKRRYWENREENIKKSCEYHLNRLKEDSLYRFKQRVRTMVYQSIVSKGYSKRTRSFKIIGCSFDHLISHIESLMTKGMTWDNYGEWHIDHNIPLAAANTEEEILKLNHYTNLKPMWAGDNIRKSDSHCPNEAKKYMDGL